MTRCVLFVLKVSSSPPSLTLTLTLAPTLTLTLTLTLTKVHHKQLVAHAAMATPLHRLDAARHGRLQP